MGLTLEQAKNIAAKMRLHYPNRFQVHISPELFSGMYEVLLDNDMESPGRKYIGACLSNPDADNANWEPITEYPYWWGKDYFSKLPEDPFSEDDIEAAMQFVRGS
jgi:hypothetical protein